MKIGIRLRNENRLLIFPERFLIAIVIAIAVLKSGSGYEMKIDYCFFPEWFSIAIVIAIAFSCSVEHI
jgi:hypothetical protein